MRRSRRETELEGKPVHLATLPVVSVQLPVFNEPLLVCAAIDTLCRLDWPRDQLEVMVLDDSTDETSGLAKSRVAYWRSQGINIQLIQRAARTEFKAGALAEAFQRTTAPFIAIFDADYRPAPSFLRETIGRLVSDPRAAFVQARLDFRNRNRNALTRAQAIELDTFLAYEQAARNWAGVPMTFNGTCGVWRRDAIEDAGGWSGASLVEDQDLSFRAFAKGWHCRNLVTVAVQGELPETFTVLVGQRSRWGSGTAQTFAKLPWRLLQHLKWHQQIAFVLLAAFYSWVSILLVAIAGIVVATFFVDQGRALTVSLGLLAVLGLLIVLKSIGAVLARRVLKRPLGGLFIDLLRMWIMEAFLLPYVALALLRGFTARQLPFLRTPKTGH